MHKVFDAAVADLENRHEYSESQDIDLENQEKSTEPKITGQISSESHFSKFVKVISSESSRSFVNLTPLSYPEDWKHNDESQ